MQLAAQAAQKARNDTKKLMGFSKQWSPGDTLRVWYPLFRDDNGKPQIAVGTVWGFPVNDMKALGLKTIFIPSTNTFDGNGHPIETPDITYQFSRMAPLFIAGEKQAKLDKIAQRNYPTEQLRVQAYSQVEAEYSRDAKKPIKPVIGRVIYQILSECLSVKMVNGKGNPDTVAVSSRTMPDELINKLYAILNDPKYAPDPEDKFFEVEWKYPVDADKSASGRAAIVSGLTPEYRLSKIDPDLWNDMQSRFNSVSSDSDSIVKRATYEIELARVRQGIQGYISNKSEWLETLSPDDEDNLMKSIDLIRELDVKRYINKQSLVDRIDEELAAAKSQMAQQPEPVSAPSVGDAPNLQDILAQNGNAAVPSKTATAGNDMSTPTGQSDGGLEKDLLNMAASGMSINQSVPTQQATTVQQTVPAQQAAPVQQETTAIDPALLASQQAAANAGVPNDLQQMMSSPLNGTNAMAATAVDLQLDV